MASLTTNLIKLKENFYVRKKPDPISAAALPRGKPEKFGEIRERLWPGVHLPTDGRFIFSDETSSLTNKEFKNSIILLDQISDLIRFRESEAKLNPSWAKIVCPDGAWHPEYQNSIEPDDSVKNIQHSYQLLIRKDRDVIRKLRFYTQAFTGYQLATLSVASSRPWIFEKMPDNWDETLKLLAGPPPSDVYNSVAIANALPPELRVTPPKKFGEIGWLYDDVIVNEDIYGYQQILSLMYENGLIELLTDRFSKNGYLKIIEIGGGYGALACHLIKFFNFNIRYAIVDIPESLAFSSIYCATVMKEYDIELIKNNEPFSLNETPGLTLIPNLFYRELCLDNEPIDLCINTLSLAEMSPVQVEDYCASISRFIGNKGIFFEQNRQKNELGLAYTFPKYFKNLRTCETNVVRDYPKHRGLANFWVNSDWSDS